MAEGWISVHRKIKDTWIWQSKEKFDKRSAWIDLILSANHKSKKVLVDNSLIEVKRGQFITSEIKLAEQWNWSRKAVRNFLKLLDSDGMIIKTVKPNKYTKIEIKNYEKYQSGTSEDTTPSTENSDVEEEKGTTEEQHENNCGTTEEQQKDNRSTTEEQQWNNTRTTEEQLGNTNNNVNNVNNVNNENNDNNDNKRESITTQSIELCKYYEQLLPGQSIAKHLSTLKIFLEKYSYDWVKEALQITVMNKKKFINSYMEKILQNWQVEGKPEVQAQVQKSKKVSNFCNYEQRNYDFNELERKLLGWDDQTG